jgi:cell division protein FtsQ
MLPLSDERSARVPMFTSFPSDKKVLSKPDSLVMQDIKTIAQYINDDSFLTAQVAQIDITQQGTYEIIPVLGNQTIRIGDANNLDEKFQKLKAFYKQVWATTGFEKYETIDVQYKNQVVAAKRGTAKVYTDTIKAIREFSNTAKELKAALNDTTFATEVVKPAHAKDSVQTKKAVIPKKQIETIKQNHAAPSKQNKKQVKKNDKQIENKNQPKAVMPKPSH